MIAAGALLLVLASGVEHPARAPVDERVALARIIIRERSIVRVPARVAVAPPTLRWTEKRGPRCIAAEGLAGAAVMTPDSIDLIARGGTRTRVELESECPALDFYTGFYLAPSPDRQICAGRDAIHARSGGECQIKRFRALVPAK